MQLVPWVDFTVEPRFVADAGDDAARGPASVVSHPGHVETTVGNGT